MEKKYSQFVPDNKHNVFQVLVDAMDSILFVTSGKKNALHLYIMKYFKEKSKKNLNNIRYLHWLCGVRWVIIHKAEAVKELLKEKKNNRKNDSSQWKERRKLLAPCFQSSMLKGYLTVFNEHAQKLVELSARGNGQRIHVR
ncbi:hypothetical protein CEXT_771471 [Caerostris extrusa]|uniref:Uncharacterized protein n=1 Tax=Caerostris extrusa TaxID=172846 RepID=A0AAV4RND1_CAEEX|nr:hypothetical protein CEXT_771471 [Caerostris extrusa]